jgi:hypothetical protein
LVSRKSHKFESYLKQSSTPKNAMEALIECMEQVGNSPYDIKLYPKYIKLAGEQDNTSINESTDDADAVSEKEETDGLGPLGAEACSTMTSAMAATSGSCY